MCYINYQSPIIMLELIVLIILLVSFALYGKKKESAIAITLVIL